MGIFGRWRRRGNAAIFAATTMLLRWLARPAERCLGRGGGGGGGGGGDGLLWHAELKPHASGEYSIAVAQANAELEDQGQVVTSPAATFVGVYDGHGGPEASRFISSRLFPHLHSLVPR